MTEEDTFNKLRREPLEKCVYVYQFLINELISFECFVETIAMYGWDWTSFEKEYILK